MDTAESYLQKTKSATHHLFLAIESYRSILEPLRQTFFDGSFESEDAARIAREKWMLDRNAEIQNSIEIQRQYIAETISISILSGAVLAIAEKYLELFSQNSTFNNDNGLEISSKKIKYCVGRRIHGVPIGLLIHAARNQHFHFEASTYHQPVQVVFEAISKRVSATDNEEYVDPAFELSEITRPIMAANVLHLIGWRNSEAYFAEMQAILVQHET